MACRGNYRSYILALALSLFKIGLEVTCIALVKGVKYLACRMQMALYNTSNRNLYFTCYLWKGHSDMNKRPRLVNHEFDKNVCKNSVFPMKHLLRLSAPHTNRAGLGPHLFSLEPTPKISCRNLTPAPSWSWSARYGS